MISINATLVVQVIHFLILVFVLNRIMFRPILRLISEREQYVTKTKRDIQHLQSDAVRLRHEVSAQEAAAAAAAAHKRKELRDTARAEAKRYSDDSGRAAIAAKAQAEERGRREQEEARPHLENEASLLAEEIVARIIDKRGNR